MTRLVVTFVILVFGVGFASAQSLMDISVRGRVEDSSQANAKGDILQKVVEEVSLEKIGELIGTDKLAKNREVVLNKIVKQADKYVLASRPGVLQTVDKAFEMDVELKLSMENLRKLLLEEGLLYELEGPPKVLPLVKVVDRVNARSYSWWSEAEAENFNQALLQHFHDSLKSELMNIGFYGMDPISGKFGNSLPKVYRSPNIQRSDVLFIGDFFKSSIVLRGDLNVSSTALDFRVEALQTKNGRVMGEVQRSYKLEAGGSPKTLSLKMQEVSAKVAVDLATQLNLAWKKGTFGSELMRLVVRSKLPPLELEKFKKMVVLKLREVKSLRERVIESQKVTYEMDSSSGPVKLAESLRKAKLGQYKVEVDSVDRASVTVNVAL